MSNDQHDIEEQIVQHLKTRLNLNFTLFMFSETAGRELLELLNKVIHSIDETQPEKIGTEKIEATVERVSELLRVLKYEFPCEPEEWDVRLTNADKDLVQPVLLWLLKDFDEMKKRAYKARYCEEVPIPEEIRVDSTVNELITQHRELREQFVQKLEEYDELGGTNVEELKKSIQDLEADKARLATRIGGFKRKMATVKNLDELIRLTSKFRQESEKEMGLQDQLQRLTEEKQLLLRRQQVAHDQLQNIRTHMEETLANLRSEFASLKNQGGGAGSSEEKNIILCQQQVVAATKRLDMKMKQITDLKKARSEAEQELAHKQESGVIEVPSPAEFAQYVKQLKTKNENFKSLQATYNAERKELAVMMRTEAIVKQQMETVHNQILKIERQRGVGGFRETRENLEKISAQKADLDDMKGKTLEEMSSIVKEIQRNIQARQNELKPFVAALQEQRKKKATVESKYLQAKQRFQNAVSEYDSVCMELEEESKKLRTEIANYQSKYHNVSHMVTGLERTLKRARDESNAQETGNPISKGIKTYSDFFQKSARALKKQAKSLKEQKKALGNQSEANQKQLEMFQSLRRLLQVKLECQLEAKKKKEQELIRNEMEINNKDEIINIE